MKKLLRIFMICITALLCFVIGFGIFYLTSQSVKETETITTNMVNLLENRVPSLDLNALPFSVRQIAHIIEFGLLGCVVAILLLLLIKKYYVKFWGAIAACFVYSLFDQTHKYFVPGREFDIRDIILDAFGYVIVIVLVHLIYLCVSGIRNCTEKYEKVEFPKTGMLVLTLVIPIVVVSTSVYMYGNSIIKQRKLEEQELKIEQERQLAVRKKIEQKGPYELLKQGVDLNVLVIGDSTASGAGANLEKKSWMMLLDESLNEQYGASCNYTNISLEGNGTFSQYAQVMNLEEKQNFDLAVICLQKQNGEEAFSIFYESLIRAIKSKFGHCSIIALTEGSGNDESYNIISDLGEYYKFSVAEVENDKRIVSESRVLTEEGNKAYSKAVINIIKQNVKENRVTEELVAEPYNGGLIDPESFKYITADNFSRTAENEYVLDGISLNGMMGIDYSFLSGNNKVDFYFDDTFYSSISIEFDYDFTQRHITLVADGISVYNSVRIIFENKEQADSFRGIICCKKYE